MLKDRTRAARRRHPRAAPTQIRKRRSRQPALHYLFEIGVSLKFADGVLELVGGIALFFTTPQSLGRLATTLLTSELLEDPKDLVANTLLRAVQQLSANAQLFASVYLLIHGIVKVGLVIALWTKKLWAYPLGGVVLLLFTVYQVYLFSHSGSLFQLFLTVVDVVILLLLWSEYKRVTQTEATRH